MARLGLGLGVAARRAARAIPGGLISAASSAATFEAVGGTWTLGDLSPVLWTIAGEGETVGAEATIPAVADWTFLTTTRGTSGGWTTITNTGGVGAATHYAKTNLTGSLTSPAIYVLDLARGTLPPGATVNTVRIRGVHGGGASDLQVDVNLDAGTLSGSEFADATIAALGANADAGYRVTITNTAHNAFEEIIVALLSGGTDTYADTDGVGVFRIAEENDCEQTRAAEVVDCRGGDYDDAWAQATEAAQPLIWEDSRGPGLDFIGAQCMSCHDLGDVGSGACTVAMALETLSVGAEVGVFAFVNASTGVTLRVDRAVAGGLNWERYRDDWGHAVIQCASPSPFVGSLVVRYTGNALRLLANGTALDDAAQTGALTTDRLWLGSYSGAAGYLLARVREIAIWDRAISDAEAAAVDITLRTAWGY
jgi:hypothetical protein